MVIKMKKRRYVMKSHFISTSRLRPRKIIMMTFKTHVGAAQSLKEACSSVYDDERWLLRWWLMWMVEDDEEERKEKRWVILNS